MSITTLIETTLKQRLPFLELRKINRGYAICIPDQPFLLKECQTLLGHTITLQSDEAILSKIDSLIPTPELVAQYRAQVETQYTEHTAALAEAVPRQQWQFIAEQAQTLDTLKQQLDILAVAAQCAQLAPTTEDIA